MTTRGPSNPSPPLDENEALDRLRLLGGRVTRARRELVAFFFADGGGHTAEELAARFADIDDATVYRTLAGLEQAGIVEHAHFGHGAAIYRRTGADTIPLVCEVCERVLHVPRGELDQLRARLLDAHGFSIDGGHFALTGRCKRCSRAGGRRGAASRATS